MPPPAAPPSLARAPSSLQHWGLARGPVCPQAARGGRPGPGARPGQGAGAAWGRLGCDRRPRCLGLTRSRRESATFGGEARLPLPAVLACSFTRHFFLSQAFCLSFSPCLSPLALRALPSCPSTVSWLRAPLPCPRPRTLSGEAGSGDTTPRALGSPLALTAVGYLAAVPHQLSALASFCYWMRADQASRHLRSVGFPKKRLNKPLCQ